ncbi:MAG: hypothetical protein LBK72_07775 [Bifidobacteriaceae bacterium]|nr:hypothetical protein [Bifidobacteriaceae bacterium]
MKKRVLGTAAALGLLLSAVGVAPANAMTFGGKTCTSSQYVMTWAYIGGGGQTKFSQTHSGTTYQSGAISLSQAQTYKEWGYGWYTISESGTLAASSNVGSYGNKCV